MQNNNYQVVNQQTGEVAKKQSFSNWMDKVGNRLVNNTLNDPKRRTQFIANIVSAVSTNKDLQECDPATIVSAGLQAEVLHFPINNSFGYAYLVPFKEKKYNPATRQREIVRVTAQFQIGYKGYIQLAIRSGQYRSIDVVEVKEGELAEYSPLTGQKFNWISDYYKRKEAKTIGYVGEFELVNGFHKQMYMSFEAMMDHADTYSQAFNKSDYYKLKDGQIPEKDMWKYSSFWYKNFDEMAKKTVLRQMLSKWGIMSVEMQEAYIKDQAVMEADGSYNYADNQETQYDNVINVNENQTATNASIKPNVNLEEEPQPASEYNPEEGMPDCFN